jgi:hypothetical protein
MRTHLHFNAGCKTAYRKRCDKSACKRRAWDQHGRYGQSCTVSAIYPCVCVYYMYVYNTNTHTHTHMHAYVGMYFSIATGIQGCVYPCIVTCSHRDNQSLLPSKYMRVMNVCTNAEKTVLYTQGRSGLLYRIQPWSSHTSSGWSIHLLFRMEDHSCRRAVGRRLGMPHTAIYAPRVAHSEVVCVAFKPRTLSLVVFYTSLGL